MGRPSNKSERRRQIVGGLLQVMAREGYEGATIAEIAREAGLTPSLVHYHFGSKQEVLLALLSVIVEAHESRMSAALASAGSSSWRRLEAYVDVHLATGSTSDPAAVSAWVAIGGEALRNAEVAEAYGAALGRSRALLEEIVEAGVGSGEFVCEDVAGSTAAMVALIQGYFTVAATSRDLIPRRSAAPMARRMASGLFLTGEGSSSG